MGEGREGAREGATQRPKAANGCLGGRADSLAFVIKKHQKTLHLNDLLPLDAIEDQLPGTQIMTMRKEKIK